MKKLVCLLCLCCVFALPALADVDLSAMSVEELQDLRDRISLELANRDAEARMGEYLAAFDGKNGFVGFTGARRAKNSVGTEILVLEFDYRNTTDKEQTVLGGIWSLVYINGAQLKSTVFINRDATSSLTVVQPGALVNHCEHYYILPDPNAKTFELVLYNGTDFNNPDKHSFEFAIPEAD